jgi:hypothetical protein
MAYSRESRFCKILVWWTTLESHTKCRLKDHIKVEVILVEENYDLTKGAI